MENIIILKNTPSPLILPPPPPTPPSPLLPVHPVHTLPVEGLDDERI